ncbi:RagB/SusD family nutrient uptake outer membrane protein [uncultured Draconibacterium sp.]|uniref:RagB/SusD family nutrient uptake outer membrane protein n=1 Tax=uncultured Draconibacterium sp. TaxID=1573823 RepID=UPI0025D4EED8|nr:RagB/SusD family nutrient uptake outer membrane protein [uncultured Draconibacterium sp.]
MKNYILLAIIAVLLSCSSCNDLLDKEPLDKISSGIFWMSKTDFEMALTANYGMLQENDIFGARYANWDVLTDNGYGQHNSFNSKDIVSGNINPTTGGYISDLYNYSYKAIARANIFLTELKNYEGNDLSENEKKAAEAEVTFLRAFHYFNLYLHYGDVPLVLEPLSLENQVQAKVDAAQIYDQVIKDLDFAIANLNAVPYFENSGHATKSTARAFKARVLINEAYGDTGVPNTTILAEVKQLCLQVMGEYSLSPNFEDVFQDKGQQGNTEIIFSVNFLAPDDLPSRGVDLIYGDWISVSPLQNLVDAFECADGLPWGTSPLTNTDDPFENRDPRLAKTIFVDYPDWGNGNIHSPTNSRPTGYGLMKFLEPDNTPYGYSTLSQQNTVILRLGEVLLMYAEAQNEIEGPDATVYQAINDIRARVNMPALTEGLNKDEMREKIRHERRIEMAFEGLRFFDLKRWHIAGEVLNSVTDGILTYHWEDKFYHWPLPQEEIDKSQGVLIQNSDY